MSPLADPNPPKVPNFLKVDGVEHALPLTVFSKAALQRMAAQWARILLARQQEMQQEGVAAQEDEQVCPKDPDGQHYIGCGCDYASPDDSRGSEDAA